MADHAPYETWAANPDVTLTALPGAVIDKSFVAAEVKRICAEHQVEFLAFDPAGMADFVASCEDIVFSVWRYKRPKEPKGVGLTVGDIPCGNKLRREALAKF